MLMHEPKNKGPQGTDQHGHQEATDSEMKSLWIKRITHAGVCYLAIEQKRWIVNQGPSQVLNARKALVL